MSALICRIRGHRLELIAWDFRARTETWACSSCPFGILVTRRLGEYDRIPPAIAGLASSPAFSFGLAVVVVVALAVGVALLNIAGGRP